jgi:hypothetical protein
VAFIRVDKIYDEQQQPREQADAKLRQMWAESMRQSSTKELVDSIQNEIEDGDDLTAIAARRGLRALNSRPVTRGESLDKLSLNDMKTLFQAAKGEPQIIEIGDDYVVAETTNIYDDSAALNPQEKARLQQLMYNSMVEELSEAMLQGYASKYKVEVQYGRMGLGE